MRLVNLSSELTCKIVAELIINYEPGVDYEARKTDGGVELRIKNSRLERHYGSTIEAYLPSECHYYLFTIFIGEHTHKLVEKYVQAFTRLRELGFSVTVYVYDCDPETSQLLFLVDHLANLLPGKDVVDIVRAASLAVLVRRSAERTKELKQKALQENKYYYEYQEALSSFTRYTNMLLKLLGSPTTLESLLEVATEVKFSRSGIFESVFEGLVRYYSVDFHGKCPDNVVAGIESVCSSIRIENAYLVITEQVAKHLASALPYCTFVPASLEA